MSKKGKAPDHDPETGEVAETEIDARGRVHRRRGLQYELEDYIERQTRRGYVGSLQTVSSVPMEPPLGYQRQPSIFDQMRAMVDLRVNAIREEMAGGNEKETLEEADDFDVGDDDDFQPSTPYEGNFDVSIKELLEAGNQVLRDRKEAADKRARPGARTAKESAEAEAPGAEGPVSGRSSEASPED